MLPIAEWRFQQEGAGGWTSADVLEKLTPAERARHDGFKIDKRRREWLLGRLTAKTLLAEGLRRHVGVDLDESAIEIARAPSGAPVVRLGDEGPPGLPWARGSRLPARVSVSHSHGAALCAMLWLGNTADLATAPRIGVDLEWIEPRSDGFVRDFLTPVERRYLDLATGDERHFRANLVWSAKEAVLKVIERGLSVDTWWLTCLPESEKVTLSFSAPDGPDFRVSPDEGEWLPFSVATDSRLPTEGLAFAGRYRRIEGYVATIALGVRKA